MSSDTRSGQARHAVWSATTTSRVALKRVLQSRLFRWRYPGTPLHQLLIVPQDLRTADPSFASEIYHGHFGLAGAIALTGAESPFRIRPPSREWERALHGFGWLRHLRAAGDEISREHARALVRDWIAFYRDIAAFPWRPEIVARRIISWLSHASVVLEGADQQFYDAVMESLSEQIRFLGLNYKDTPDGVPRLTALTALTLSGLCAAEEQAHAATYNKPFSDELKRQILIDGGHVSRNPVALIELLLDLLPLRQCYIARDWAPPDSLTLAIDRMMPAIRFFRLGDGNLARFNGTGATPTDSLATVLAYDDVQGSPVAHAAQSGYCRAELGNTVIIADMGAAPPGSVSSRAHAGCMSFEMSSGRNVIIANCGAPGRQDRDWRLVARSSAAHSTLVVNDTSSSRFLTPAHRDDSPAEGRLSGPTKVTAKMMTISGTVELEAVQDGYEPRFGIRHQRNLKLEENGARLSGSDRLTAPHGLKGEAKQDQVGIAIRFHLHPEVRAQLSQDGRTALLALPNHEGWQLASHDALITVEESVFLADNKGPRKTLQVVLNRTLDSGATEVNWTLEKSATKVMSPSDLDNSKPEHHELPLG